MVSGHEAVMVTVQAPGGTKSLLPLALEDGAGRYTALLTCSEVRTRPNCQYATAPFAAAVSHVVLAKQRWIAAVIRWIHLAL